MCDAPAVGHGSRQYPYPGHVGDFEKTQKKLAKLQAKQMLALQNNDMDEVQRLEGYLISGSAGGGGAPMRLRSPSRGLACIDRGRAHVCVRHPGVVSPGMDRVRLWGTCFASGAFGLVSLEPGSGPGGGISRMDSVAFHRLRGEVGQSRAALA